VLSAVPEGPPTGSADAPGNTIVATTAAMTSITSLLRPDMARVTYNQLIAPPQVGGPNAANPDAPGCLEASQILPSALAHAGPCRSHGRLSEPPCRTYRQIHAKRVRIRKAILPPGPGTLSNTGAFRTVKLVRRLTACSRPGTAIFLERQIAISREKQPLEGPELGGQARLSMSGGTRPPRVKAPGPAAGSRSTTFNGPGPRRSSRTVRIRISRGW